MKLSEREPSEDGFLIGRGETFDEAFADAAEKAKERFGPGWFRLVDIHVNVENPIRDYRIVLSP
jgi:hypothetical protein